MSYKLDPAKDKAFIQEFYAKPIGKHSPGLLRILNALRYDPKGYQLILFCRIPYKEWVLAEMPPDRNLPIRIEANVVFNDLEAAERFVFTKRWQAHTGQRIPPQTNHSSS